MYISGQKDGDAAGSRFDWRLSPRRDRRSARVVLNDESFDSPTNDGTFDDRGLVCKVAAESPRRGWRELRIRRSLVTPTLPERRVLAVEGDQLIVGTQFGDSTVNDDADAIGVVRGVQAVRDRNHRAAL